MPGRTHEPGTPLSMVQDDFVFETPKMVSPSRRARSRRRRRSHGSSGKSRRHHSARVSPRGPQKREDDVSPVRKSSRKRRKSLPFNITREMVTSQSYTPDGSDVELSEEPRPRRIPVSPVTAKYEELRKRLFANPFQPVTSDIFIVPGDIEPKIEPLGAFPQRDSDADGAERGSALFRGDGGNGEDRGQFAKMVSIGNPEEFEVEEILATRQKWGETEYLVRWKGYSQVYNRWIKEMDCNCEQMISEFERKFRMSKRFNESCAVLEGTPERRRGHPSVSLPEFQSVSLPKFQAVSLPELQAASLPELQSQAEQVASPFRPEGCRSAQETSSPESFSPRVQNVGDVGDIQEEFEERNESQPRVRNRPVGNEAGPQQNIEHDDYVKRKREANVRPSVRAKKRRKRPRHSHDSIGIGCLIRFIALLFLGALIFVSFAALVQESSRVIALEYLNRIHDSLVRAPIFKLISEMTCSGIAYGQEIFSSLWQFLEESLEEYDKIV